MTENSEPSTEGKTHTSSRNPALEGGSGQYVEGDYGDAGTVADVPAGEKEGEYPEGDFGEAGTTEAGTTEAGTIQDRGPADDLKDELIEGQVNAPKNNDGGRSSGG